MVNNPPAMQEAQIQSLRWEESLEKGMEAHSSILVWRIPQSDEPGRLHTVHRVAKSPTGLTGWHYRKQSTAQKTITPVAETWDHPKRVVLFPRWLSLSEKSLSRVQPEPVWLLCPWDSPSKNTAMGNHDLPQELGLGLLHLGWALSAIRVTPISKRNTTKQPVCQHPRLGSLCG